MEHIRLVPDMDSDPDMMDVGWCGARVYELLLKVSGAKDLHGRLPAQFQRPAWLARFWNLTREDLAGMLPEDFITAGMNRLLAAGKLVRDGAELVINGWEKFYKPTKPGRERTKDWRNRREAARAATPVRDDGDARDVGDEAASRVTDDKTPASRVTSGGVCGVSEVSGGGAGEPAPRPLGEQMEAVFLEEAGCAYQWDHASERALEALLKHQPAEILRRWRIALRTPYPRCDSVARLKQEWNSYGRGPPTPVRPKDATRGHLRAEEMRHDEPIGEVKL